VWIDRRSRDVILFTRAEARPAGGRAATWPPAAPKTGRTGGAENSLLRALGRNWSCLDAAGARARFWELVHAGEAEPGVFFGSAMTNFGVRPLSSMPSWMHCPAAACAPPQARRPGGSAAARVQAALLFKLQANMGSAPPRTAIAFCAAASATSQAT